MVIHTDQKHANRRIVVTGLESGGNIQLFTVCFSLNECASALIFKKNKTIIYSKTWIRQISTVKVPCYGIRNLNRYMNIFLEKRRYNLEIDFMALFAMKLFIDVGVWLNCFLVSCTCLG